ncbi:ankyrin repeat domain-containing protein [Aspergillus alliaceus]|uniref:ankyrin repeat domain-containing protein n=1 Tax=Petromyces alliaceus TaxID=209559 RepID=UPI0012A4A622|nr:ankyrin repeat-containing domain protein [Aspergillus alliaceus]KAB8229385.1 ankyrin repeat-containing domain protein [Aspergillus alliaceus]
MAVKTATALDQVHVTVSHSVQCANNGATAALGSPFNLGPANYLVFPTVPIQVVHLQFNTSGKVPEIIDLDTGAELPEAWCSTRLDDIASASTSGRILMPNLPASGNALLPPFDRMIEGALSRSHSRDQAYAFVRDLGEIYRGPQTSGSHTNATPILSSPPEIPPCLSDPNVMSPEERQETPNYQPLVFYTEKDNDDIRQQDPPPQSESSPEPQSPNNRPLPSFLLDAQEDYAEIVSLLIKHPNKTTDPVDVQGRIPLSRAAEEGHIEVVRLLLAREDVDANFRDAAGRTPLAWAACGGHEDVVKLLLDRPNVEADTKCDRNWTPLAREAQEGHEEVVKLLLGRECIDIHFKADEGCDPLDHASTGGHEG